MYTLIINHDYETETTKVYATLEAAYKVFDRLMRLVSAKQKNYDTVQLVNYIAVMNDNYEFEAHVDGLKILKSANR